MRSRKRICGAAILTVAGLLCFPGCEHGDASGAAMPQRPPPPVTTVRAITRDVPVYLDEIGRVVPIETVAIIPQVGGKIIAAPIEDGAYVKKGELLFEIDSRPFRANLEASQAQLESNKSDHELAGIEFERLKRLMSSANASDLEFEQRRIALAIAKAKIDAADAAVAMARLDVEYARITSPIDGRAGAKLIHVGNVVKENDQPLMTIDRLDPIYAEFTITENDLGIVRKYIATAGLKWGDAPEKDLSVEVDIPGNSARVLAALGNAPATQPSANRAGPRTGKLTFLDNAVQAATGVVKLRATLANADHYFWPGQFVNVRLILTMKKGAVLVPATAEQVGQVGPFVYVVNLDNKAVLRPIKPGQMQGDMLVIEQGVEAGEQVIVAGQMGVQPDGPVRVTDGPASAPAASAPASASAVSSARQTGKPRSGG